MAYALPDDLDSNIRLINLQSSNTMPVGLKQKHIAHVEAIINGKLSKRYSVPFGVNSVPPIISAIATDLASMRVLRATGIGDPDIEKVMEQFGEAKELLDSIASGDIAIVNSSGGIIGQVTTTFNAESSTENYKPIFDMTNESSWEVDPDLIDAENDARD